MWFLQPRSIQFRHSTALNQVRNYILHLILLFDHHRRYNISNYLYPYTIFSKTNLLVYISPSLIQHVCKRKSWFREISHCHRLVVLLHVGKSKLGSWKTWMLLSKRRNTNSSSMFACSGFI